MLDSLPLFSQRSLGLTETSEKTQTDREWDEFDTFQDNCKRVLYWIEHVKEQQTKHRSISLNVADAGRYLAR